MAVINDSVGASENLLEVVNSGARKFAVTGAGGLVLASGTGGNTISDSSSVNRAIFNPTAKTIVDGSATSLFEVPITAGTAIGGTIHFSVFSSDGTDHQTISGIATYSAVNKAGTTTRTITYATANEAKAVSAGTITLAFTMTDDTNKTTVKLQPTGSLTETTYNVIYTVLPLRGAVTIL